MAEAIALKGVFIPITTPFDPEDLVSREALRSNLARYNHTRLAGYVAAGSTGEAVLLSMAETEELWAAVVEASAADKILVAGTAAESTTETITRTRRAAALGYAVALVRTPHYYRPQMTPALLAEFYRRVADASPIPILIYSIPQYTGVTVEAPLVAELAEHPNIVGIKDSSGSVQRAAEIVRATPAGFHVLVGSASTFFPALAIGAAGGIMALADALPEECVELYEAAVAGQYDRARNLQERLLPASSVLVSRYGVAGMKYALDQLGYYGGPVREPLRPLEEAAQREIKVVLAALKAQVAKQ
jgi:4-hydroxy-2-oxoglutarate aldolase